MKGCAKLTVAGLAAVFLAGCSQVSYKELQTAEPAGTAHSQALFNGYKTLAAGEHDEHDVWDAEFFATKALATAGSGGIGPQEIADRRLPAGTAGDLTAARAQLMAALAAGAAEKAPNQSARAQIMFDCWMQEQEENLQPNHIAACRDGFAEAMGEVDVAMAPAPAPVAKAEPKPAPAVVPEPSEEMYVVYFDFDSAKLDERALAVLNEAASASKKLNSSLILVEGNTDLAGPDGYNMTLSEERAKAVRDALLASGASNAAIKLEAYGKTRPAIKTADGVRESGNRRVEIVIRK